MTLNKENNLTYVGEVLRAMNLNRYSQSAAQPGLAIDTIASLQIPVPPFKEQNQIAKFIEAQTSKMDRIVQKDKLLIELLKEERTALINQTVTKGIDPKRELKDSGIEWIGNIPEKWSIVRLKYLLENKKNSIKTGPFGSQLTIDEMNESEVKVYNQRNIICKDETFGENFVSLIKYHELIAFKAGPGDLLITTRGTIGRCLKLSADAEKGILHPCVMKIRINNEIAIDGYIEFLIEESELVKVQFLLQSNATTIDVIYQENLKNVILPIPSIEEQKKMLIYLKSKTSKIEKTIDKIQAQIKLLEEYKKSLINNVMTGKIDVRHQID